MGTSIKINYGNLPVGLDINGNPTSLFAAPGNDINVNLLDLNSNVIGVYSISGNNITLKSIKGSTVSLFEDNQGGVYGRDFLTLSKPINKITLGVLSGTPWDGNTNRFTDELGGQTYTNLIILDWNSFDVETGELLGYYNDTTVFPINTQTNQISNAAGFSVAGFSSWRLVDTRESMNITNFDTSIPRRLNYPPFNNNTGIWWTRTESDASNGFIWRTAGDLCTETPKTSNTAALMVRTFNISEL